MMMEKCGVSSECFHKKMGLSEINPVIVVQLSITIFQMFQMEEELKKKTSVVVNKLDKTNSSTESEVVKLKKDLLKVFKLNIYG